METFVGLATFAVNMEIGQLKAVLHVADVKWRFTLHSIVSILCGFLLVLLLMYMVFDFMFELIVV